MDNKAYFKENLENWRRHFLYNSYSGIIGNDENCVAYKNIVKMKEEALPFILEAFKTEPIGQGEVKTLAFDMGRLVKDIVGEKFKLPRRIPGRHNATAIYTRGWLVRHLKSTNKYN